MKKGTKLYYAGSNFELVEYTFIRIENGKYIVEYSNGEIKRLGKAFFDRLCMSKIMILTEIEEELRFKIENIHKEMRNHKLEYNPLDSVMVIYSNVKAKQHKLTTVHQYDAVTGKYIKSYNSITQACIDIGKPNNSSHITSVCKGRRHMSCGFRWSYDEVPYLSPIRSKKPHHSAAIINQYNLSGALLKTYKSIDEATKESGITKYTMSKILKSNGKHKKFVWKRINDALNNF